jgi:hypothetical protein
MSLHVCLESTGISRDDKFFFFDLSEGMLVEHAASDRERIVPDMLSYMYTT